ncbi:MAG: hypothetical protein Q3M24_12000 [Candidatus Electrothrix aestuarii]|uniref:Uncharacterized protein n=1 Tax=Candidatus Electrothrix aestuarii TaxID=3062594 RepID=A0AAU8LQ63_9BACT|nr:hypothetical protein [Candidatus Electrothrix aestuarii]WPD24384.1 MAG: hypothetical protein SD837_07425 [Candidatus Electrothrix sp. GW3-3]
MKIVDGKVQWAGLEAGCRNISTIELIRYLQKVDSGSGDYVQDRQEWQQEYTVDMLLGAVDQG